MFNLICFNKQQNGKQKPIQNLFLISDYRAGLPDGIFPYQNLQFWFILRGIWYGKFRNGVQVAFG
jgi:hypothetical protein